MADDKERLVELVRSARFDAEGMCDEYDNCMVCPAGSKNGGECVDGYIADRLLANGVAVIPETGMGDFSDGYHTFNELYHHRAMLFSVICHTMPERAWKSKQHHDGTMYDGMFIVGIDTPEGQATYHYDVEPYWDMFDVRELDRAPVFDGHTPDIAIRRIAMLAPSRGQRQENAEKLVRCLKYCASTTETGNNCGGCERWEYDCGSAHCVDDLLKQAAEALERQRWIPVAEMLPEAGNWVFGYAKYSSSTAWYIEKVYWTGQIWGNCVGCTVEVTHWMPMPELPKEGTQ